MDDEKIETLDRVSILQRGVEDDKHLTAIFSSTKKPEITAIFNKEPAKKALIDLSEYSLN